ncbi:MAG TPA: hypothetical protein VED01_27445 [Burkholderiales bacterium]|nr:hypothetical protein [Burkholderiales bacterium]
MNKDYEAKIGSTIYTRIQALHIPEADRQRALNALYEANLFVDGIVWVAKKIEQVGARLFLKPALKH